MSISESHSAADDAVTHERFRRVMASFVTGVTVVTTQVRGEIRGMTANAFMSGSLDPPLCVISVALKARMHAFLMEAGHFGVNILARGQEPLIGHFSGRPVEGIDPKYDYAGDTPLLAQANATIAAKVIAQHACGDHSLFIGHIFALRHSSGLTPIVLHIGRLASLLHTHEQTIWPTLDFW
ncbi:MAG: flavin reductase family protein [Xanthobacteraceae bacterium]